MAFLTVPPGIVPVSVILYFLPGHYPLHKNGFTEYLRIPGVVCAKTPSRCQVGRVGNRKGQHSGFINFLNFQATFSP